MRTLPGRRPRLLALSVLALSVLGLLGLPAGAQSTSGPSPLEYGIQGEGEARLDTGDFRVGEIAPSRSQRAMATELGATRATWNAFGTPHVLVKHGGYLSGPREGSAVDVARAWVGEHRELFRLSQGQVDGLEMLRDSPLYDSPDLALVRDGKAPADPDVAHVVLFRQRFGALPAAWDGLLTVGVQRDGRIAWASSTVTGDETVEGGRSLSATEAIQAAAADVRFDVGELTAVESPASRFTTFAAAGAAGELQRVREMAMPTPTDGVRRAYEVTLLDGRAEADGYGNPIGFISFVDAESGEILFRTNRVDHLADGLRAPSAPLAQAPSAEPFSGATGEDGACTPEPHGPFAVGEDIGQISVLAATTIPAGTDDDITINLRFGAPDGDVVASQDFLTSPEILTYAPPTGVPAGDYFVEVCPFTPGTGSISYVGTFTASSAAQAELVFLQPRWRVFPANPPFVVGPEGPLEGEEVSEDTRVLWCWLEDEVNSPLRAEDECDEVQQNSASRVPWDAQADGTPSLTTDGNNASTAISEASFRTPDTAFDRPAPDPTRDYQADWNNEWFESKCDPSNFAVDNDDDASTYNLFVMHNRMHDWAYYLGLTENNGALQKDNFGNTPPDQENDPELGSSQAGRTTINGRDNANQLTLQDGVPGITNQYLWEPLAGAFYGTCTDGAYDMAIVAHEYGHAISNRMTVGPDVTLGATQGQSESWSDLIFAEYFRGFGIVASEDANPFALAPLVTGDKQAGIRNYGMNQSPLNFANLEYDGNGTSSPHADGEIWSAINFDIAERFNATYDADFPSDDAALQERCARGELAADACPGNRRWAQLMFDGFLLQPAAPSMVDSRDAMLAADMLRFDGANQEDLFGAFARGGLGEDATAEDANDRFSPASYSSPASDDEATVTFVPMDVGEGLPETMSVFVGDYEARAFPAADTDPETEEVSETASFVPGEYRFLTNAPGFGHFRFALDLAPGEELTVRIPLRRNHASATSGAEITGDGVNLDRLIDDTEQTNWASLESAGTASEGKGEGAQVEGRQFTVTLGDEPQMVREVQVSATLAIGCEEDTIPIILPGDCEAEEQDTGGQSRFSALRSFDIQASTDGEEFTTIFSSADDAFPGERPRPRAPNFIIRPFDVTDTEATHLRLVVRDNQCTGGPDFQGESNPVNDPIFSLPDCDSEGSSAGRQVLSPPFDEVRAAELQAFSQPTPEIVIEGRNVRSEEPPPAPPVDPPAANPFTVERIGGVDRDATAILLSQAAFESADTAILARDDTFPDALTASGLAAEIEGPVLLTARDNLRDDVLAEIERLGVEKVYLAGGEEALTPEVAQTLADADIATERLGGAGRVQTAALIAGEIVELGGQVDQAIIARADDFADALASGSLAAAGRAPVLLTSIDDLPEDTLAALDDVMAGERVILAGGTAAVSAATASELEDEGYATDRLGGAERYETAALLVEEAVAQGASFSTTILASGTNFPDALAAGPAAAQLGGVLGLTDPLDLSDSAATEALLIEHALEIQRLIIAGGVEAIAPNVLTQAETILTEARAVP